MSAALGLKVRTVVSLHLWDLFRTRAQGEPGSEGVRRTCRHTAYRRAARGHADAHGRLVRIPAGAQDGKVKQAIQPVMAVLVPCGRDRRVPGRIPRVRAACPGGMRTDARPGKISDRAMRSP